MATLVGISLAKVQFMVLPRLMIASLLCLLPVMAQAATLFTYIGPESEQDPRTTYDRELLRLASSPGKHDPCRVEASPVLRPTEVLVAMASGAGRR
ncbi:hypothetical protein JD523_13575 [Aeromonas enteropelogenes]|uniref:hypothetical protein n=1 Tax=Aeromonas enteropelogenes TaxID=29489 RepID=UPI00191CD4E6|nr:hypothetical protein [Aeromonas enteropelogenes]MBL0521926.1 hypothetical protein [Aeromonas enteropelogenes]